MRGFNLIELMIVIAVIGVLALVGIPNLQNLINGVQTRQARDSLYTDLMRAKSVAVAQQRTVVFCGRTVNASGDDVCNNSSDWNDGWIAFIDSNNDGQFTAGERYVAVRNEGASGVVLGFVNTTSTPQQISIRTNSGAVRTEQQGNFYICSTGGNLNHAWRMSVNSALRPLMANNEDVAGLIADANCQAVGGS